MPTHEETYLPQLEEDLDAVLLLLTQHRLDLSILHLFMLINKFCTNRCWNSFTCEVSCRTAFVILEQARDYEFDVES